MIPNLQIESLIQDWANCMVNKYVWLKVLFEYSESRGVYLVDCKVDESAADYDDYCVDAMSFEDEVNAIFDIKAPLFTDNSNLFDVSSEAKCVTGIKELVVEKTYKTNVYAYRQQAPDGWLDSFVGTDNYVNLLGCCNNEPASYEYALAA